MVAQEIKVTCPYYINSDRLLDLLASAIDGYSGTEEIEKSVTSVHRKSRGFRGALEKIIFSISAEEMNEVEKEEKETKKTTQIHTGASLLNKAIKKVKIKDLAVPTDSEVLFECGDIVEFTGTISLDKLGAEDYITFGFEAEADIAVKEKEEGDFDRNKAERRKQQKKEKLLLVIAVVYGLVALPFLFYGFINRLSETYLAIIIALPIVCLTAWAYISSGTKDTGLSDLKAIRKDRKRVYEGKRVKILYDKNEDSPKKFQETTSDCSLYFVGELYDDYLYQSGLKDFLGRNVSCIGIVKHIEEHTSPHAFYGEVEIITIYA